MGQRPKQPLGRPDAGLRRARRRRRRQPGRPRDEHLEPAGAVRLLEVAQRPFDGTPPGPARVVQEQQRLPLVLPVGPAAPAAAQDEAELATGRGPGRKAGAHDLGARECQVDVSLEALVYVIRGLVGLAANCPIDGISIAPGMPTSINTQNRNTQTRLYQDEILRTKTEQQ